MSLYEQNLRPCSSHRRSPAILIRDSTEYCRRSPRSRTVWGATPVAYRKTFGVRHMDAAEVAGD